MIENNQEVEATHAEIIADTGNSFLDDLLNYVEELEVEELNIDETKEGFSIQSTDHANYIVKKLKEIRGEKDEAEEAAKYQLASHQEKIANWLDSVNKPLVNQENFYLKLLEDFASDKLKGSSKKSLKLIEGTLQFRKQVDMVEYEEEVLLAAVENDHPDYTKTKTTVDKKSLRKDGKVKNGKLFLDDKEIQGVTVTARDDKFDVK